MIEMEQAAETLAGDDRAGQLRGIGVLAEMALPDGDNVAEQPQRHHAVDRGLMLEQQVEKGGLAIERGAEEEVGVLLAQLVAHEAAGAECELVEVEALEERRLLTGTRKRGKTVTTIGWTVWGVGRRSGVLGAPWPL